jgi:DNA-directed RNA polymerase specialized sigma24 family protein
VRQASKSKVRQRLEQELSGEGFRALLQGLKEKDGFFRQFEDWADVIAFMHSRRSDDPLNDKVLRPIFGAHSEDGDARWWHVLTVIFWPGLVTIHQRLKNLEPSTYDRGQDVHCIFLEVLSRIDTKKRPHRLVQKVINDTFHRLRKYYHDRNDRMGREFPTDPDEFEYLLGAEEHSGFEEVERREEQEARLAYYRRHRDNGTICEDDLQLLVATRVEGNTVAEFARRAGLNYQTVKKRRQRAEKAIARAEEKAGGPDEALDPAEDEILAHMVRGVASLLAGRLAAPCGGPDCSSGRGEKTR